MAEIKKDSSEVSFPQPGRVHSFQPGSSREDLSRFDVGTPQENLEKFPAPKMLLETDEGELSDKAREEYERRLQGVFGVEGRGGSLASMLDKIRELDRKLEVKKGLGEEEEKIKKETEQALEKAEAEEERERIRKESEEKTKLLRQVIETKVKEIDKTRKEVGFSYVETCHTMISELESVGRHLEYLKNPFPYDSRWNIQLLETMLDKINGELRGRPAKFGASGERIISEGERVLGVLKGDVLWALSATRITEAMGPSYEVYFDGELEISQLRMPRSEILTGDFMRMMSKSLRGLGLEEPDTRKAISGLFDKLSMEYKTRPREGEVQERPLREEAVEIQDSVGVWLYKLAAAHQKNLEYGFGANADGSPVDKEAGENYAVIDYETFRFLSHVFNLAEVPGGDRGVEDRELTYINSRGERVKVVMKMLNIFAMPQTDENATAFFKAALHFLSTDRSLLESSLAKIKEDNRLTQEEKEKEIKSLANKVVELARRRVKNWDVLDQDTPRGRLVDVVVNTMIHLERGSFACGELGWGYEYEKVVRREYETGGKTPAEEKDEFKSVVKAYKWLYPGLDVNTIVQRETYQKDGQERIREFVVVRKSEMGSIYDNHDLTTVMYLARHIIDYDAYADDRGTILFATVGWYRDLWNYMPPYWRPEIGRFARNDSRLLEDMGITIAPDGSERRDIASAMRKYENVVARKGFSEGKKGLQEVTYGKFDAKTAKFIDENSWALVTWCLDNPGKGGTDYLVLPVFMPTMVDDLNYWRTTSLEAPSAKIERGKDGTEKPKSSIWKKRLNGTLLSDLSWENAPVYRFNWFLVTTDQMERWLGPMVTPAEFSKVTKDQYEEHYGNPSGMSEKRRGKRARLGKRANEWGAGVYRAAVMPQNAALTGARLSEALSTSASSKLDFITGINKYRQTWAAAWVNTLLDMPHKVLKVENYPGTAAMCFIVTHRQLLRLIASAWKSTRGQVGDVNNSIHRLEGRITETLKDVRDNPEIEETLAE